MGQAPFVRVRVLRVSEYADVTVFGTTDDEAAQQKVIAMVNKGEIKTLPLTGEMKDMIVCLTIKPETIKPIVPGGNTVN
jgi:hypothetical protein